MKKLIILFLFLWILCFPSFTYASGNFNTRVNSTYTINESGVTHVVYKIILENITSQYYAQVYNFSVGFQTIDNVTATDDSGVVSVDIKKKNAGNLIVLTLNKKTIGLGKQVPITISFDTPDVAKKMGSIWEINIPGLANQEAFEEFHVHVDIPHSFGKPSYTKPVINTDTYDFSKEQLSQSGISIGFGKQETYHFSLKYHLRNSIMIPITQEIALPPTTSYQDVSISSITPKPTNVRQDKDGNWLASIQLMPFQTADVTVMGTTVVHLHSKQEYLTNSDRSIYLADRPYWQVNDPQIKKLAQTLKTPAAIYQYVTNSLTYDYSRISTEQERLGAVKILSDPKKAVCLEFTDLFIAIARAAGIPAREVDGYAYTQNPIERPLSLVKDILHAWPEYYNDTEHRWIMIDPTWQNTTRGIDYFTTLDFDHVAFTVKGQSSDYPIAAGGYKLQGQENNQDIVVDFDTHTPSSTTEFIPSAVMQDLPWDNNTMNGILKITNTGSTLIPEQQISLTSSLPLNQDTVYIPNIPPLGHAEVPISVNKPLFLTSSNPTVTIQIANNKIVQNMSVSPFWNRWILSIGGIIIGSICIGLFIFTARARHLSISGQQE